MSDAMVEWVLAHSPTTGAVRLTHVVLAHHADKRRRLRVPQAELAQRAGLDVSSVHRHIKHLVETGLVRVLEQPAGRRPALLELAVDQAQRLGNVPVLAPVDQARSPGNVPAPTMHSAVSTAPEPATAPLLEQLQVVPTPVGAPERAANGRFAAGHKRPAGPHHDEAHAITKRVFGEKQPRPAQSFVAVMGIAERLLAAEWPADEVAAAMLGAPTISTRACELWRAQQHPTQGPRATIGYDRSQPSGRIQL